MMISWIGNCYFCPVNSSLQTENWNCVQHLDKVNTFRHVCDMVQIQQKNSWAETRCTEIYFQFSFVQISPLPSYCCMQLLLWACLFLWALTLAIPSFGFWSITKLIKRQWQKSLFACGCRCCSFFWRRAGGGGEWFYCYGVNTAAPYKFIASSIIFSRYFLGGIQLARLNSNIFRLCFIIIGSSHLHVVFWHKGFWTQKWVWYSWVNQSH